MQLIYLYIGDIGRNIYDQGISFSDEYSVSYNKEEKKLNISHNNATIKNIYKKNILGVDLLVGRNGSGKTTILNLLGLSDTQRRHEFPIRKENVDDKCEKTKYWFAVYHLKEDLFCIEGHNPDRLSFLDFYTRIHETNYAAIFRFDTKSKNVSFLESLNTFKYSHTNIKPINKIRFLYYSSSQDRSWYRSPTLSEEVPVAEADRSFCRYHIDKRPSNVAVFKYLCDSLHDRQFKKIMGVEPKNVFLTIDLNDTYDGMEFYQREDEFSRYIYGDEKLLTSMPIPDLDAHMGIRNTFSKSQCMLLRYLEIMLVIKIDEAKKYGKLEKCIINRETFNDAEGESDSKYLHRKTYLLTYLKKMMEINVDNAVPERRLLDNRDWELINLFCEGIEDIKEEYYINGTRVKIPLDKYKESDRFLDKLLRALDENRDETKEHVINHEYYIRIAYHNLSAGEMDFIHFYASLYTGVNKAYGSGLCVLLLDEPDAFFHPEWSRCFIESLTKVLSSRVFRKFNYQILLTTHSPILLADVPRKHIHCILIENNRKVKITDAKYGFLSNINIILLDSMFVNSSFGSFAEGYINSIIKKLNKMDRWECNDDNKQKILKNIDEIEDKMRIVNEPVIRTYIERKIFSLRERIYSLPQNKKERKIKKLIDKIRWIEVGGDFDD